MSVERTVRLAAFLTIGTTLISALRRNARHFGLALILGVNMAACNDNATAPNPALLTLDASLALEVPSIRVGDTVLTTFAASIDNTPQSGVDLLRVQVSVDSQQIMGVDRFGPDTIQLIGRSPGVAQMVFSAKNAALLLIVIDVLPVGATPSRVARRR